jgi:NADH dehydrogenase
MGDGSQAVSRAALNAPVRGALGGALAGIVGSVALALTENGAFRPAAVLIGTLIGAVVGLAIRGSRRFATLDGVLTAAVLGIPLWTVANVIVLPVILTGAPAWTAPGMRAAFASLVGWMLYGAGLALLMQLAGALGDRLLGPLPDTTASDAARPRPPTRIVILGGGFAGVTTAKSLERAFGADRDVEFTLVSETNALLFTPMLAEVAGSSLEATHISCPLRTSLRRTQIIRGCVRAIDLTGRSVELGVGASDGSEQGSTLPYDHLVLALGSTSNYFGQHNVEREALDFKSLLDAIRIRNRVIEMFERADRESDVEKRSPLLTFVVAGGGFAGVELAGALNDFARGIVVDYPRLHGDEIRVVLVHARDRVLPELSPSLAAYAQDRMSARGVRFLLNTRVADARPGVVVLHSGEELATRTLVWTAGTAPNVVLQTLPVPRDKRGAVIVDTTLAVPGQPGLWALGDCASVADARTGEPCPPTAQFALREARTLATNLRAAIRGAAPIPFHFDSLGALCVIGHQTACAELRLPLPRGATVRFSGLLAWAMWRAIYLLKLPGFERKIRVLFDWTIELFFPRDTVQTLDLR